MTSFRAPYLKFPDEYLPLLERAEFLLDSSQAKYKKAYYDSRRAGTKTSLTRIPASLTSSALRIPKLLREAYVRAVSNALEGAAVREAEAATEDAARIPATPGP